MEGLRHLVEDLGEIDAREISTIPIGDGIVVRVGRYGPYVEETVSRGRRPATGEVAEGASGQPRRATITDDIAPDEMTPAKARELLEQSADDGRVLGQDPETGRDIVAKAGRYGPTSPRCSTEETARAQGQGQGQAAHGVAVQGHGPRHRRPRHRAAAAVLPRVVGTDPEGGDEITAQNGRYGPYLKKGTDSRSLQSEEQLFTVTLEEALADLRPAQAARPRPRAPPRSRSSASDPVSGKPMVVKEGRFGAYVTDGETNATLRKDDDPESITPERGAELLAEKRAKGPTTRKRATKKSAKKTTTKKSAAKKTTAKKSAAKKA